MVLQARHQPRVDECETKVKFYCIQPQRQQRNDNTSISGPISVGFSSLSPPIPPIAIIDIR